MPLLKFLIRNEKARVQNKIISTTSKSIVFELMGCGNIVIPQVSLLTNYKVNINSYEHLIKLKQRKLKKFYPHLKIQDHQIFQNLVGNNGTLKQGQRDYFIVHKLLKNHFLFGQLTQIEIQNIMCCMELFMGNQNNYIFKQGDPPSLFFIMTKGRISLQIQDTEIKQLQGYCCFGQVAVIYSTSRTASIKCLESCRFWCLHSNIIKRTLKYITDKHYKSKRKIIDSIHWFEYLEERQKKQLAMNIFKLKYSAGEIIYQNRNLPIGLFYILNGHAQIKYFKQKSSNRSSLFQIKLPSDFDQRDQDEQLDQANQNCSSTKNIFKDKTLGFQAILSDQQVNFQATALSQIDCISIGRLTIQRILGPAAFKYSNLYHFSAIKWTFHQSKYFQHISLAPLHRILAQGTIKFFKAGQFLLRQRQRVQHLFICLQGTLNGKGIGHLINQEVLTVQHSVYTDRKLQKLEDGNVCVFEIEKINALLGSSKNKILNKVKQFNTSKNIASFPYHIKSDLKTRYQILLKNQQIEAQNIQLKNLNVLSVVARGEYSICLLVKHKINKNMYFLKLYPKKSIFENNMVDKIINQRQLNLKIKANAQSLIIQKTKEPYSPLIPKMYQTFRDQDYIYFLMQYLRGGDLFNTLNQQIFICRNSYARFFFACMVLAVQHLHKNDIIYRDFRHQNFVFDESGYLYLVDFANSKQIKRQDKNQAKDNSIQGYKSQKSVKYIQKIERQLSRNFRTKTLVGQPHYVSPQMAQGKPYNFATDFWSMGVLLYDLLIGYPPFGRETADPIQIYQQILANQKQVKFPKFYKDKHGRQLIQKLMAKNPQRRQTLTFFDIKNSQFLKGIQWIQILLRKFQSPFHPKIKNTVLDSYENNINKDLTQFLQSIKQKQTKFSINSQNHQDLVSSSWDDFFSCKNL